jgi:hypothetical protein
MADLDYELGLESLRDIVQREASEELYKDFSLLQFRLLDCLSAEEKYGKEPGNTAVKNRVLEQLMIFTSGHFGLQFITLCQAETSVKTQAQAHPNTGRATIRLELWKEGDEIKTQQGQGGTRYIVHKPITVRWSTDHGTCYQQAQAQQIGTRRVVWLKQVQTYRDTSTSTNWQAALQKEGRLLETLEERQDQSFPRHLAFEQAGPTTIFVHSATQGHSWQDLFGSSHHALNSQQIYSLLRSAISLCASLRLLHEKNLAHRMLLPEHILVLKNNRTVLQDVGLSTWKYEPGEGPEWYRAPRRTTWTRLKSSSKSPIAWNRKKWLECRHLLQKRRDGGRRKRHAPRYLHLSPERDPSVDREKHALYQRYSRSERARSRNRRHQINTEI